MTAAVSLVSFLALIALYRFSAWDGYLLGASFYVLAFLASLLTASIFAARSKDRRCVYGVGVLWLAFIGSHVALEAGDPNLVAAGIIAAAAAAWFILYGVTRWEWTVGALFLASGVVALLGELGAIPTADERIASGFIVFSHPDIAAIIGHIANAVLGLGAGDTGRRVRTRLRVPVPWVPLHRSRAPVR